jgi:hypothetical protein
MTPEAAAGWSALVAAAATVFGAVALVLFFGRGQPWGTLNDAASVVLMLATIPVALVSAAIEAAEQPFPSAYALAVAVIGIAAMLVAAWYQALLVVGRVTYEQTKGRVLAAGAFVGLWYLLVGAIGFRPLGQLLAALAVASGIGYIAIGYGFAVGNERHPLSVVGGLGLLVASTGFLAIIGWRLVTGHLVVPDWTA